MKSEALSPNEESCGTPENIREFPGVYMYTVNDKLTKNQSLLTECTGVRTLVQSWGRMWLKFRSSCATGLGR